MTYEVAEVRHCGACSATVFTFDGEQLFPTREEAQDALDDEHPECFRCGSRETVEMTYEDSHHEFSVTVCAGCGSDE
jgi:hypothetical protein